MALCGREAARQRMLRRAAARLLGERACRMTVRGMQVTARLVSSEQSLVPVRVCLLIHVGFGIRQILQKHIRSERLCRLRCR
jgi:hypothetical protein